MTINSSNIFTIYQFMDFTFLKLPQAAYQIQHDEHYIKRADANGRILRNIFHEVPLESIEEISIMELERILATKGVQLPSDWTKINTLKYWYSGGFDLQKACDNIVAHLKWRADPNLQHLSSAAEGVLKSGVVYSLGRDKLFRPLIFIQVSKISTDIVKFNNTKTQLPPILNGLCYLLNTVQLHMLAPYYVEKWRIIVDLTDVSMFRLPVQIIKSIIDCTQSNYTATLEQLHLFNPPLLLIAAWKLVEKLMHPETAKKIQFCDDPRLLHEHIDPDQLQFKYGGTIPNRTEFWPIMSTYKVLDQSMYQSMDGSAYYTVNSLNEIPLSPPQKVECCNSCAIF